MSKYQLAPLACEVEFEQFITDLCFIQFGAQFQLFGRKGQTQHGIDGINVNKNKSLIVHQCKKKNINREDKVVVKELLNDLEKDVASFNEHFVVGGGYAVHSFIFATTFKNDTELQEKAIKLSSKYNFNIILWSWDVISRLAEENDDIFNKYFAKYIKTNGKLIDPNNYMVHLEAIVKEYYCSPSFSEISGLSTKLNSRSFDYFDKIILDYPSGKNLTNNYHQLNHVHRSELIGCGREGGNVKKLLIGEAGVGKTTLLKSLCIDWAKEEIECPLDIIIYIRLREWEDELSFTANILKSYYDFDNVNDSTFESEYNLLKENSSKILFVFDGFDEFSSKNKGAFLATIAKFNNVIFSSRTYDVNPAQLNVSKVYEVTGFSVQSVFRYIDKTLSSSNSQILKTLLQRDKSISELAHTPLILEIMCILLDKNQDAVSLTKMNFEGLYKDLIDYILSDYCALKGDETVIENEMKIIHILAESAFDSLSKNKPYIDVVDVTKNRTFFKECLLKSGILKSSFDRACIYKDNYSFYHLTFKEYFAAMHVAGLESKEITKIVNRYKYDSRFLMFFKFLTGMCRNKNIVFDAFNKGEQDLVGYYSFNLTLDCCNEIISKNERKKYLPNILTSNLFQYCLNRELNVVRIITKIKDEESLCELFRKLKHGKNKVACFEQLLLHAGKTDEIITDMILGNKDILPGQFLLKSISLNVIEPVITCSFDIKEYIRKKIMVNPPYDLSSELKQQKYLLDETVLISALVNLDNYNEEYRQWVKEVMKGDDVNQRIASLFIPLPIKKHCNSLIVEGPYNTLNLKKEPLDDEESLYDEDILCEKFDESHDKLEAATELLHYLNDLTIEQTKHAKPTQKLYEYILSVNEPISLSWVFIKFASRFLKRSYYKDIDELICDCIDKVYKDASDYSHKDLMYIIEHLALCNTKSYRLRHIIFEFIDNDEISFHLKIDVAKCLFIIGERGFSVMDILFKCITSERESWHEVHDKMMRTEIVGLISGYKVNCENAVLEPNMDYFHNDNDILSISSLFGFLHECPQLIDNENFIQLILDTFICINRPLYYQDNKLLSIENGSEISIEVDSDKLLQLKVQIKKNFLLKSS